MTAHIFAIDVDTAISLIRLPEIGKGETTASQISTSAQETFHVATRVESQSYLHLQ